MKFKAAFIALVFAAVFPAVLKAEDVFTVDLDRPLPSRKELLKKYGGQSVYDRRYDFYWDIGNKFDAVFAQTVKTYGATDKRLKKEGEDQLLSMIKTLPEEAYPYIGPYLHTVPNMSPKILNLPGIKETKNRFPERIAPQLAGIENLEFLSPYLYFLLMPEVWPGNAAVFEDAPEKRPVPKVKYNPKFYAAVRKMVPPEEFYPGAPKEKKLSAGDLRTVSPDALSPLTSADVQAVMKTFPAVDKFASREGVPQKLLQAGALLDAYETEQGRGLSVNALKDMVNPCARLIQKVRIAGLETDFALAVSEEGFRPEEWAYTCDKTIKAYRVSKMTASALASVMNYRDGVYRNALKNIPESLAVSQIAAMGAIVKMYQAPLENVMEVRKNRRELDKLFKSGKYMLAGQPVAVMP